jgi:microcystin-dependent protein
VAEIRVFPFNFAPKGWALCNGQLLPISQNAALFSLLGTNYGGNGTSTFGLPNLMGLAPMHHGQGPGLSSRVVGETGGEGSVVLTAADMPGHSHTVNVVAGVGDTASPADALFAEAQRQRTHPPAFTAVANANAALNAAAIANTGGSGAHNNLQPYLVFTFCIALVGVYPTRN